MEETPTVPIALDASNSTSDRAKRPSSMREMTRVPMMRVDRNSATTASARRVRSSERRRRAMLTSVSPFTTLSMSSVNTATVVVFMPPPVDAGDAPIIISMLLNSLEPSLNRERSKELKPAVRIVTDWKKAFSAFSPVVKPPSVPGPFHSTSI